MATPVVLVVGATGKQGKALLSSLLAKTNPPKVLALSRNINSDSAQGLQKRYANKLDLVQGDSTKPEGVFSGRPKGSINSLFLYTVQPQGKKDPSEESQAIPFIDAAVAHGVKHIVFSSVDRGGDQKSWENPCEDIEHFHAKHLIELHLRDKAIKEAGNFTWTILRPVCFMDNMNPGMFGSLFASMWNSALAPTTKLQLVSTTDIGVWGAEALTHTDTPRFHDRAITLAGDSLTLPEAKEIFRKTTGKEMPQSLGLFGKGLMWMVKEVGNMFNWFEKEGYGADIPALRKEQPGMLDLSAWLRQESQWKK